MKEMQEDGRFCRAYLRTMDAERAAAEIGRKDGYAMLAKRTTQQKLERMRCAAADQLKREDVLRQLARLAFGRVDDAVQLALRRESWTPAVWSCQPYLSLEYQKRESRSSWWIGCGRWRHFGSCWTPGNRRAVTHCIRP